jgi:hypothetical protein
MQTQHCTQSILVELKGNIGGTEGGQQQQQQQLVVQHKAQCHLMAELVHISPRWKELFVAAAAFQQDGHSALQVRANRVATAGT